MPTPKWADRGQLHNATLNPDGTHPGGPGATDHGTLTGLGDDDHPQYATDVDLTTHAATPHGGGGGSTAVPMPPWLGDPPPEPDFWGIPGPAGAAGSPGGTQQAFIGATVYHSVTQSVATGASDVVLFDSEDFDTDGFHSTTTNTGRFTIPAGMGGKYLLTYHIHTTAQSPAPAQYDVTIRKNGGTSIRGSEAGASSATNAIPGGELVGHAVADLAGGDFVDLTFYGQIASTIGHTSPGIANTFSIVKLDSGRAGAGIGAMAYRTSAQSPITAETAVLFDAESFDTDGFHDLVTNTSRLTIPIGLGGKYAIIGGAYVVGIGSTNYVDTRIRKNGTTHISTTREARSPDDNTLTTTSCIVNLVAGDYVELTVQSDDTSFNVGTGTTGVTNFLSLARLDSVGAPGATGPMGPAGAGASIPPWLQDGDTVVDHEHWPVINAPAAAAVAATGGATAFIGAKAYNSTTQSIADSTFTPLTLDSEEFDTDGFHSTSSNTSRMTIPAGMGGKYLLIGSTYGTPTSASAVDFMKNGTTALRGYTRVDDGASNPRGMSLSVVTELLAGDYVEFRVYHATGSSIAFGHASSLDAQSAFSIVKLDSGKVGGGIGCRAYNAGSQTITTATNTAVLFDSEEFDTDNFHSTSSNTSRFTVPAGLGGKYLIHAQGYWNTAFTAAGLQIGYFKKNGTTEIRGRYREALTTGGAGLENSIQMSVIVDLVAGDYVEWYVYQGGGSNHDLGTAGYETYLEFMRLDSGSGAALGSGKVTSTSMPTTSSTTYVDLTGMTVTLTTGARRLLVAFTGNCYNSTSGKGCFFDLLIDGVSASGGNAMTHEWTATGGVDAHNASFTYLSDVLSAGSHTVKIQWRVSANTGFMYGGFMSLSAQEQA